MAFDRRSSSCAVSWVSACPTSHLHEAFQERDVRGRVLEHEGVEARGLAVFKRQVSAAHGSNGDFGAAILVEEDAGEPVVLGAVLLGAGDEEVRENGLASARHPEDERIGQRLVAVGVLAVGRSVEVEVVGLVRRRQQEADGLAPGVSVSLARIEAVQRRHVREVHGREVRDGGDAA